MLKINKKMTQAIQTFNKLDSERASIVISRIFSQPSDDLSQLFSEKEKLKLIKLMQITELDLSNMLRAFSFILMHAVAEKMDIESAILGAGMDKTHVKLFMEAWITYSSSYAIKMREKQAAISGELKQFTWDVYLPIEDSKLPIRNIHEISTDIGNVKNYNLFDKDERNPQVKLCFQVKEDSGDKTFAIKLKKEDVQKMFESFEKLQEKLDNLL